MGFNFNRPSFRKYNNIPTEVDGYKFDSLAEARHYQDLLKLKKAGIVLHIDLHPVFILAPGVKYIADFMVYYADGHIEVQDVKGVETKEFKIKKKLFNSMHPLAPLKLIKARGR